MWIGELITEKGHRQWNLIDHFRRGSFSRLPQGIASMGQQFQADVISMGNPCYINSAWPIDYCRCLWQSMRVKGGFPVQYAKRVMGRKVLRWAEHSYSFKGQPGRGNSNHLFAMSLMLFPGADCQVYKTTPWARAVESSNWVSVLY